MPKPVTVSVEVPQARDCVFDVLDVMANHEGFNDHLMHDWELSGPERGVGAKARVQTRALGMRDVVDIEVVEAEPPSRIVEYLMTAHGPEPAGEETAPPDYDHYVEHQVKPVADAVLSFLGKDCDTRVGARRQLSLF